MILDACYFCTTPYQILTSLSMVISLKEKADLYIIKQFDKADIYAARIRALNVYREVKVIYEENVYEHEVSTSSLITHFRIARSYLHVENFAKKVLIENTSYEKMYISSRAYIPRMVQLYFCKKKIETEVIYYDDGEGSYINPECYKPRSLDAVVRVILFGKESIQPARIRYLHSPQLYKQLNPAAQEQEIRKIEALWNETKTREMINYVFDYDSTKSIKEKVIILDSLSEGDERKRLDSIYQKFVDYYGIDNVIIKKHPRDKEKPTLSVKQYTDYSTPFEVLCLNMDMDEKVLICFASTAMIMPKLLFDKEPKVFMLYKVIDKITTLNESRDRLYSQSAATYRTKDKYNIVEDEDQLDRILCNVEA